MQTVNQTSILDKIKKGRLQYISQGVTPEEHLLNIEAVCKAGVKWIQLRLKDVSTAVYLDIASKCRIICNQYNAVLIINDSIEVAQASAADGVHLGKTDESPKKARLMLGDYAIIGGTANTLKDCIQHIEAGVNYIGLGPFRYTKTKKNLSPVLGIEGYQSILDALEGNNIPVIGIGGIKKDDITSLTATGVYGIAVSTALTATQTLEYQVDVMFQQLIKN